MITANSIVWEEPGKAYWALDLQNSKPMQQENLEIVSWDFSKVNQTSHEVNAYGLPERQNQVIGSSTLSYRFRPDSEFPFSHPTFAVAFDVPEVVASIFGGKYAEFEMFLYSSSTTDGGDDHRVRPPEVAQQYDDDPVGWEFEIDLGKIAQNAVFAYITRKVLTPHLLRYHAVAKMLLFDSFPPGTTIDLKLKLSCKGTKSGYSAKFYHNLSFTWIMRTASAIFASSPAHGLSFGGSESDFELISD